MPDVETSKLCGVEEIQGGFPEEEVQLSSALQDGQATVKKEMPQGAWQERGDERPDACASVPVLRAGLVLQLLGCVALLDFSFSCLPNGGDDQSP